MKLTTRKIQMVVAALAVLTGLAANISPAYAGLITLTAEDQGWVRSDGLHFEDDTSYGVGRDADGDTYRNFFSFNVAGFSVPAGQKITGLQLSLDPYFYVSSDPTETYDVYDYTVRNNGAPNPNATSTFDNLGSGVRYGSYVASQGSGQGAPYLITLSPGAISAFNLSRNSGGYFNLGGTLSSLGNSDLEEDLFGFNGGTPQTLIVTTAEVAPVPELNTMALMLIAMVGLLGAAWMRKKKEGDAGSLLRIPVRWS